KYEIAQKIPPRSRLHIGPASAIRNSSRGDLGSWVISETPPKINRVIDRTGMPMDWATTLWLSSWARTEPKKSRLVMTPAVIDVARLHPGWTAGK
ncbi:MAG: hypothetical protein Q8O05_08125, partial [Chloroflexota bacterium]|nr:hypothetical protein [Chloroflexota bacterium]